MKQLAFVFNDRARLLSTLRKSRLDIVLTSLAVAASRSRHARTVVVIANISELDEPRISWNHDKSRARWSSRRTSDRLRRLAVRHVIRKRRIRRLTWSVFPQHRVSLCRNIRNLAGGRFTSVDCQNKSATAAFERGSFSQKTNGKLLNNDLVAPVRQFSIRRKVSSFRRNDSETRYKNRASKEQRLISGTRDSWSESLTNVLKEQSLTIAREKERERESRVACSYASRNYVFLSHCSKLEPDCCSFFRRIFMRAFSTVNFNFAAKPGARADSSRASRWKTRKIDRNEANATEFQANEKFT